MLTLRAGIITVVAATVLLSTSVVYSSSVGNNSSGPVAQSDPTTTSTATTGASSSGANNNIKVERGAAYTAPSISRAEIGTEVTQLHTFMGGITFANTELDTRVRLKIEVIIAAYREKLIDEAMAKARIGLALNEMDSIQEERRVPLLGFSCNHRTIFNAFGVLCN